LFLIGSPRCAVGARRPFARNELYSYCPDEFLAVDFRKQLAAQELIAYRPDVACLQVRRPLSGAAPAAAPDPPRRMGPPQEVTQDVFDTWLAPLLAAHGFVGSYTQKTGSSAIGCATFVAARRWRIAATHAVDLTAEWAECPDLAALVNGPSEVAARLKRGLERSTTVAQAMLLESVGEGAPRRLWLLNTHLFGHPDATHVRLVQVCSLMRKAARLAAKKTVGGPAPGLVLCGDFNSLPDEGVRELLEKGAVGKEHPDWRRGTRFKPIDNRKDREQAWFDTLEAAAQSFDDLAAEVCGDIAVPAALVQACRETSITFCTDQTQQVVDYIYFSAEALAEDAGAGAFPDFDAAALTAEGGLPSRSFPSDHVALVQDLVWR
jgi:mRNA deadenylase 3'-5' endonuclease subunit Ccr4